MRYLTRRDLDRFKIFAAIKYVGKNVIELNYTKNSDLPDAIKATLNKDIIGKVNGVASLDGNGNVPLEQLGNIDTAIFVITDKLPTEDIKDNKIYIVPSTTTEENNIYTEYCYINNVWEKLGEFKAEVDLSEYAKKTEIPDTSNFVVMANDETPAKLYSGSKGTATISTTSGLNVSSMSGGVTLQPNTLNLASNDGFNFSANSTGIVFTIKGVGVRIGQNGSYTLTSPSSSGINTAHTQYTVPVVDGTFYDLTNKADTSSIPTKLSQLTNDANFITSYTETDPVWTSEKSNYYTKTEIDNKGYLTEHQSLTDYAKVIEVNKLIENEKSNRETSIKEVSDKVNEYPGFKINDSECIISPYKVKQWSFNTIIKWGSDGYSYAINDNLLSDIPYPDTTFNLYISNSNKDNWNKITAYKVKSLDDNNSDFFTYISGADLDISHKLYIGYSKIDNPNIEDLYIIQDLVKLGDNKYFCKIEDEFADMNAFIYDANNKTWYEVSCIASKVFTLFNCENTINDISDAIVYNGKGNYDYTPQDDGNIAIGSFAYAGSSGIAIGNYSNANAEQNIAIGNGATTEGDGCIALGLEAKVKDYQSNAVAIGYGVCVDKNTIMKIGHSGCEWITVDYPNEDVYIKGIGGFDGTNITVNDSLNTNIKSLKDVIDSKADKSDILAKLDNITAATTAEEVVTKFNDLLTDLKAKGYMVADTAK